MVSPTVAVLVIENYGLERCGIASCHVKRRFVVGLKKGLTMRRRPHKLSRSRPSPTVPVSNATVAV
jgi:hypothetical protein